MIYMTSEVWLSIGEHHTYNTNGIQAPWPLAATDDYEGGPY